MQQAVKLPDNITQEELHKLFTYDKQTGFFEWKIRPRKLKPGDRAGCKNSKGYIQIIINKARYKAHRLAWLYVYGYFPENEIDHINRVRHDNRIDNLREVSRSCNVRNIGNPCHNTSGVKGVVWHGQNKKWRAQISIKNRCIYIGTFDDFGEAVFARLAAEQCLGWSGCDLSSPAFRYAQKCLGSK